MFWRRYDAFISYSHKDETVVKPLVELLSLNDRQVFWDRQLQPGDRWEKVIQTSVKRSSIFVLFWCCDTRQSEFVEEEIAVALRLKKKIVPVKLCHAAMPQPLTAWQWIDLRDRVQHQCCALDHEISTLKIEPKALAKSSAGWKWAFAGGICLMLLVGADLTLRRRSYSGAISMESKGAGGSAQTPAGATAPSRSAIPPGATPLPNGFALVSPSPSGGWRLAEFDRHGTLLREYSLSAPPAPSVAMREQPLPWWYENSAALLTAGAGLAAVLLLFWALWAARKRTRHTLQITRDYLERMAI